MKKEEIGRDKCGIHPKNDYFAHKEGTLPICYYHFEYPVNILNFQSHWHEEIEITYVCAGSGKYRIDSTDYTIRQGDIIFIAPNTIHSGGMADAQTLKTDVFIFHTNLLCPANADAQINQFLTPIKNGAVCIPSIIHPADRAYTDLKNVLFAGKSCMEKKEYAFQLEVKAQLLQFFTLLYRNAYVQMQRVSFSYTKNEERIKAVIEYIERNYPAHLPVERLAQISGFSPCHFMNLFKKYTGSTCTSFVNQFRLDCAARKLLETDDSVLSIALNTGFNNVSFFNRAFKKQFGQTPGQYRKRSG